MWCCLFCVIGQERGEIFFFYRPKVGKEEAHGAEDVQRLYIVLRPESRERPVEEKQARALSGKESSGGSKIKNDREASSRSSPSAGGRDHEASGKGTQEVNIEKQPLFRFIIMGRKSLPDPTKRSRPYWGFVEMVTTSIEDAKTALRGEEYDTATRGHRHSPPARAVGEGIYRILRHNTSSGTKSSKKAHTHLIYRLEFPGEDNENGPQRSLNIEREGSFLIQIRNPDLHGVEGDGGRFRGIQNKRKALFPAHLQGQFGQLMWGPADPPDMLNYEGCEFLLIAASDDLEEELGLDLKTDASCCDLICTFGEDASASTSNTLLKGTWA
ncbi:hypothetical protein CDL15_Pgr007969 [Punica granatum]|uniref:Uncharacterized protein n=1 Tax=Punica granatum TaxID=22663 RepID=A0A218XB43_PUNGR|nr:hypothetical protein CDL15_Pgr007969 [Punica granatum]